MSFHRIVLVVLKMPFHCSNLWIWDIFILCYHLILSLFLQPVCVYCVYCGGNWTNLVIQQPVQVSIETNAISKAHDPYCCKIIITPQDSIGGVTIGHIPRELSQFVYYFLQEGDLSQVVLPVYSIDCHLYLKRGWKY